MGPAAFDQPRIDCIAVGELGKPSSVSIKTGERCSAMSAAFFSQPLKRPCQAVPASSLDAAWQDVAKSDQEQKTAAGRDVMKSFQVVDFNAPLQEVDQPTPQP